MAQLFRTAVVVARQQPYLDWANSLADGPKLTAQLAPQRGVYLGPHSNLQQTIEDVLDEIWQSIFEEELFAWSIDERDWPAHRTREMFEAGFAVELCESIVDLVPDDPLTEDDMDFEELQIALNTCSFCGAELSLDSGRMITFKLVDRKRLEHREGRVLALSVGRERIITCIVAPEDSAPAQEDADIMCRACGRRCEKQIEKLVPRALRELEQRLAEEFNKIRSG